MSDDRFLNASVNDGVIRWGVDDVSETYEDDKKEALGCDERCVKEWKIYVEA